MNKCNYCEKYFSRLDRHYVSCKQKPIVEKNKLLLDYENEISNLKEQINKLQTQREMYEREREQLRIQREQYERELQTQLRIQREQYERELQNTREQLEKFETQIFEIAKQPKQIHNNQSTTNNNQKTLNVINQLAPMDFNQDPTELIETIRQAFTEDVFFEGPDGIARLVVENLLIDPETGKFRMICSDSSRKNFKYTDKESGEIKTDHGMIRLHDLVKKPLSVANMEIYLKTIQGVGDYAREQSMNRRERNDGFILSRHQISDKIISHITK